MSVIENASVVHAGSDPGAASTSVTFPDASLTKITAQLFAGELNVVDVATTALGFTVPPTPGPAITQES